MKNCWHLPARALPVVILIVIIHVSAWAQGMMGGHDGMMRSEGMRGMMQQMMGDMLPPPTDPASLPDPESEGVQLLQRFCTQCHYLPGPGLHTSDAWPAVVSRMDRRMQMMGRRGMMMGKVDAPTEGELVIILDYLQKNAQQPLTERLSPALESEKGQSFRAICSQCHVLPDPGQHNAEEWPAVVEKMKAYMATMGKPLPDEKTLGDIVGFLQQHASQEN